VQTVAAPVMTGVPGVTENSLPVEVMLAQRIGLEKVTSKILGAQPEKAMPVMDCGACDGAVNGMDV
jgi:hypothetical protein